MKIKTTVHIHYVKYSFETEGEYQVYSCKLGDAEHRVYVGEQEVELEVPDNFDPRPAQIAALMEEQTKAAAAYQKTVTNIQRRIAELQAIEFTA
jgi:hypothetical protein